MEKKESTQGQRDYLRYNSMWWDGAFVAAHELDFDQASALIKTIEEARAINTARLRKQSEIRELVMGFTNKKAV